jgi:protein regulator of cytokinesis 1
MASIPMWERENGKAFLVNGARVVDVLAETMESEANNKENKRVRFKHVAYTVAALTPVFQRAGSTIPSRATTPAPAPSRKHTVTPSVSGNGPNKRQRVAPASGGSSSYIVPPPSSGNRQSTTTPTFGASSSRAPFSARNGREYVPPVPPIPGSKGKDGGSSLPRPVSRSPVKSFGPGGIGLGIPNAFASRPAAGRVFSGASVASSDGTSSYGRRRSRRESFKPRASVDGFSFSKRGMPGIWGGGHEEALQEENEDF